MYIELDEIYKMQIVDFIVIALNVDRGTLI